MSDENLIEVLAKIEFLHGLGEDDLNRLAEISRLEEFAAESTVFKEHDPSNTVYFIVSGKVALVTCTPKVGCRTLTQVGPGELMGWSSLTGRNRLFDTARALVASSAIAINGEKLLALCEEHPKLGFELIHRVADVLAQRLASTRLQLLDMTGHRLPEVQLESD